MCNVLIDNSYVYSEVYKELYYQFPKFLIKNETYAKLSNDAKIAYMLFKDRFELSIDNQWIDNQGQIYLEFTQKNLMSLLNCYEGKVKKIINELESSKLLIKITGNFDKSTGKKKPNRYYLLKPQLNEDDIYKNTHAKIASGESLDTTIHAKIASGENLDKPTSLPHAKIAQELNNKNIDTNRHLIDSDKDESQDRLLLENFVELHSNSQRPNATFIPDQVLSLIKTFSSNYVVAQTTVKTIHNAKHKAEQVSGVKIAYEELDTYINNPDQGLYTTVLRAYQKQKTEQVKDMQNLIFTYVKNWFIEYPIQAKQAQSKSEDLPKVSTYNWLE